MLKEKKLQLVVYEIDMWLESPLVEQVEGYSIWKYRCQMTAIFWTN